MIEKDLAIIIALILLLLFIKDILVVLLITCVVCVLLHYAIDDATWNKMFGV
jgi:hypothetical protein